MRNSVESQHLELLKVAHEAVDRARAIIQSNPVSNVSFKSDKDMVSDVDLAVEASVRSQLSTRTPTIGFVGEETSTLAPRGDYWVLDPVDGTANFIHGLPMVAVSLALIRDGIPIVGVVDIPSLNRRYSASDGGGAHCGDVALRASMCARLSDAIVSMGDYATGNSAPERNKERLRITAVLAERAQRVRMLGAAAIDLVWVAEGLLDASVMLSNKPWDTAAGVLIARESGANVTDGHGHPHTLRSSSTVASAPRLTSELVQSLRIETP